LALSLNVRLLQAAGGQGFVWPRATRPRASVRCQTVSGESASLPVQLRSSQQKEKPWPALSSCNGWHGHCCAPGHEGVQPSDQDLHEFCNMGYASKCSRLPADRDFDAVRFSVAHDQGSRLQVWFVCETGHRPMKHGNLEYDVERQQWISSHSDPRIQRMVECYVQSYLKRRSQLTTTIGENS
jgi:hypothetical protein